MVHIGSTLPGMGRKSPKHGSFRVNLSAISLGGNAKLILGKEGYMAHRPFEDVNKEAQSHNHTTDNHSMLSGPPFLVTFSIKVYYREHLVNDDWHLCSRSETKPLVATFEEKSTGVVTCLLSHTERMPLFLNSSVSSVSSSDCKRHGGTFCSSTPECSAVSASQVCRGSNHLLESHKFKVALGVAVIRSGKVVYVGHGSRILRAIDLFGTRISLEICGDSCNTNSHSADCISNACVFFDINVKYLKWVPCTEHCQLPHEFSRQYSTSQPSIDTAVISEVTVIENEMLFGGDTGAVPPLVVGAGGDMLDEDGSVTSNSTLQAVSPFSTFRSVREGECRPLYYTQPITTLAKPSVRSSVYVGTDPKYRVSVLDINNLSSVSKNRSNLVGRAYNPPSKEVIEVKHDVPNINQGKETGFTFSKVTEEGTRLSSVPLSENEGLEADASSASSTGFFSDLVYTIFGEGNGNSVGGLRTKFDVPVEGAPLVNIPSDSCKDVSHVGKLVQRCAEGNKVRCLLKIGQEYGASLVPSMPTPIQIPLNRFIDQLADTVSPNYQRVSILNVCLKPRDVTSFMFTVKVPEDHIFDMAYTKTVLEPFYRLPANSISNVAFLLEITSSEQDGTIDETRLRCYLQNIKLGGGMSVQQIEIGSNISLLNVFINGEHGELKSPLRKFQSDTALYRHTLLSNTIAGLRDVDNVKCVSARDHIGVDTWISTMNHILSSNGQTGLIQISSPRTSLPICIDQKWVVLLKQLLSNIKAGSDIYQPNEAVKFIWPTW